MRTAVGLLLWASAAQAFAQANTIAFATIPALDDLGLVGLMVAVGVIGGWLMRRRK